MGLPSAASLFVEWGTFELNAALAGRIGIEALAAHSVFAQYSALWYSLPVGFAQAAATLGSNALGAGAPDTARRLVPRAYVACTLCGLLQGGAALALRGRIGAVFSTDAAVVALVDELCPVLVLYEMCDVVKCAGMVYLRETGRPGVCAKTVAISSLGVGLPLSWWLGLGQPGLGLRGVWFGMCLSWLFCTCVFVVVLVRTDWEEESRKAVARSSETPRSVLPVEVERGSSTTTATLELSPAVVSKLHETGGFKPSTTTNLTPMRTHTNIVQRTPAGMTV